VLTAMWRGFVTSRAIFQSYDLAIPIMVAYSVIFVTTGQEQHGGIGAKYGFGRLIELARAGPVAVAGQGSVVMNASASCRLRGVDYV
jgi:hypothetical protein